MPFTQSQTQNQKSLSQTATAHLHPSSLLPIHVITNYNLQLKTLQSYMYSIAAERW